MPAISKDRLLPFHRLPEHYWKPSASPGEIREIFYETSSYRALQPRIRKSTLVYLPSGYDDADAATRYDILYLMHGVQHFPKHLLGGAGCSSKWKNILDHMIENGDIDPMLFVFPTFYQGQYNLHCKIDVNHELTQRFPQELCEDLIPAVETELHTFARSVDPEGQKASREHRAFGGFSMGAVAAWNVFLESPDAVSIHFALSGDSWTEGYFGSETRPMETALTLQEAVRQSGWTRDDFSIFIATGTEDMALPALERQVDAMQQLSDTFLFGDEAEPGNCWYLLSQGGEHTYEYVAHYLYNGLPRYFKSTDPDDPSRDSTPLRRGLSGHG